MTWDDVQDRYREMWEATLRQPAAANVATFHEARKAGSWSGGATRARQARERRQAIASAALRMRERGLTYAAIARQLGESRNVVTAAIKEATA